MGDGAAASISSVAATAVGVARALLRKEASNTRAGAGERILA